MQIKNWSKFQHFKDRRPPWVKLYRDILDDLEWHELDPLAAKVLVMLWLIASEDEGRIPDNKTLAFRLRFTESKTKEIVSKLNHWLEQDDINVISGGYQQDIPEKETERDKEKEKEAKLNAPEGVSPEVWDSFVKQRKASRAVITESVLKTIAFEAEKAKWTLEQALAECAARGWRGFKADWVMPKPNPADIARVTVPSSNEPDPALQKIKADEKITRPPTPEERAIFNSLRRKA